MRKNVANIVLGVLLVGGGIIYALSLLGVINFQINFDGWWTLFIIIPCIISIISDGFKLANSIGLTIGTLFLLSEQKVIPGDIGFKLAVPIIVVIIGLKLIFKKDFFTSKDIANVNMSHSKGNDFFAIFSGNTPNFSSQTFDGCSATAIFGGIELLLNNAIINQDCVINTTTIFGGTDIVLPNNVNLIIKDATIFGGVDNKFIPCKEPNAPTVYINSTCIFAGLDVK